jgi:hypothetical protein
MKTTFIYGLYSTRDNEIRYVGKSNNPKSRLKDHVWASRVKRDNTHKACWIRKELNDGYTIQYNILETCDITEWAQKEIEYIKIYPNLTNHDKGGFGGSPISYDMSYDELKEWVDHNLPKTVNTRFKWVEYIKSNELTNIPLTPNKVYRDRGWISWANLLNTKNHRNIKYVSYEEFKQWVRDNVANTINFRCIVKPIGIPCNPERIYKEWVGWYDCLPNCRVTNIDYWSYDKAKQYLNEKYGKITGDTFRSLHKNHELPIEIPKKPERVYDNFSYKTFLNPNYVEYIDYQSAKKIVHGLNIQNNRAWREFTKSVDFPTNIPKSPETTYREFWVSWYEWLGNGK